MNRPDEPARIVARRRSGVFAILVLAIACVVLAAPARALAFPVTTVYGIPDGWTNADVTFTLGVEYADVTTETRYSLNGVFFQYAGPVTVVADGITTLVFQSHDSHTAREDWQTAYIRIDRTPPSTTIDGLPGGWTAPGTYGFTLAGVDSVSSVASTYYRIDNGDAIRYAGGAVPVFAARGVTVEYWSVDAAGNQESPRVAVIRVDDGGPFTALYGLAAGWSRVPVTLTLAAESAHGAIARTSYRLGEGGEVDYDSPVTVSAEGATTVTYRSLDTAGNQEAARTATVRVDSTAPVSSASGFVSGWTHDPISVVVTAHDALSGAADIFFGQVGEPLTRYGSPAVVSVGADGQTQYTWYAVDAAGNAESPQTRTVMMDRTAPTSWASGLPGVIVRDPVSFSLGASDGLSGVAGIYYTIDGGSPVRYVSGDVRITKHGATSLTWWATDVAGNAESPHTASVFIATVGPTTGLSGVQAGWTSHDVTVTLTPIPGDLPIASTLYRLDQGSWQSYYADPAYRTWLVLGDEGVHTMSYYSIDQIGNAEPEKSAVVRIDKTPPLVTGSVAGSGTVQATFSVGATDGLSGVAHIWSSLDGLAEAEPSSIVVTAPGPHAIAFRAVDNAGNSTAPQTVRFTVAETPGGGSTPPHTSSDAAAAYVGTATVHLSATPGGAAVVHTFYRLDAGPRTEGTTVVVSTPGAHTLEFWSEDAANVAETPHAVSFTVERISTGTIDTAEPTSTVKLVFIHHSTGQAWLSDGYGDLAIALRDANYYVSDTNYGWGPDGIGDRTDVGDWWTWFRGPSAATYTASLYAQSSSTFAFSRLASDPGGPNQVVMFKSCFPNSAVGGSAADPIPPIGSNPLAGNGMSGLAVGTAKGVYLDVLEYTKLHPEKLFVLVVTPPLRAADTSAGDAANARALAQWLVDPSGWLKDYPRHNVVAFDYFTVLTGGHHRVVGGAIQHVAGPTDYLAFPTGDSHPSAAGDQIATAEFVPLLNAAYNSWKRDTTLPPPPVPVATKITIASNAVRIAYPRAFVLSGVLTPASIGDLVAVWVRKPGTARWSYSSNRLAYAASGSGALWWYRYTPKLRGTYYFRAQFTADAARKSSTSSVIGVAVR